MLKDQKITTVLSIWSEFLKLAKQEVGTQVVETWFKCVSIQSFSDQKREVVLNAPNQFVTNWLTRNYLEIIRSGLKKLFDLPELKIIFEQSSQSPHPVPVNIVDQQKEQSPPTSSQPKAKEILPAQKTTAPVTKQAAILMSKQSIMSPESGLSCKNEISARKAGIFSKYRFDNLVVGPHNHLAYSASLAISKGAIKGYNPLFIYGKTGLGKTHLLNCIGNETREIRPNAKIVYKTSDKFVDEFIRSIRFDRIDHFKEKYCTTDLLLIDDIQFLSQKEQTQEVFFHIFNNMHQQNKQIVLSSDMPPSQIKGLQDRLKSRFGWGLIADIQMPAFETRVAILTKKAEEMNIELTRSVAAKIAQRNVSNIRELEGTLTLMSTMSILKGVPISEQLVDQLTESDSTGEQSDYCPNELIKAVARDFSITIADIKSKKRDKNVSLARQLSMYLLREKTAFSLKTIGELVGGRSHATVLHAIENVQDLIKNDPQFYKKVTSISDTLAQTH